MHQHPLDAILTDLRAAERDLAAVDRGAEEWVRLQGEIARLRRDYAIERFAEACRAHRETERPELTRDVIDPRADEAPGRAPLRGEEWANAGGLESGSDLELTQGSGKAPPGGRRRSRASASRAATAAACSARSRSTSAASSPSVAPPSSRASAARHSARESSRSCASGNAAFPGVPSGSDLEFQTLSRMSRREVEETRPQRRGTWAGSLRRRRRLKTPEGHDVSPMPDSTSPRICCVSAPRG